MSYIELQMLLKKPSRAVKILAFLKGQLKKALQCYEPKIVELSGI